MKDGNKEKRTWMFFQSRSLFIRENHYVRITLEGNKLRLGFDDGSYKETDGVVEMDANDVLECYCSSCYTWYQFLAMAGFVFMAAAAWHLLNEPSGWRRGPDEAFGLFQPLLRASLVLSTLLWDAEGWC